MVSRLLPVVMQPSEKTASGKFWSWLLIATAVPPAWLVCGPSRLASAFVTCPVTVTEMGQDWVGTDTGGWGAGGSRGEGGGPRGEGEVRSWDVLGGVAQGAHRR